MPHHQDERLFSGTAALANDSQADFKFHVLPPDTDTSSPLDRPVSDFRKILSYLDRRKANLGAARDDLLITFYDGVVQAREAGFLNLFLAGARYDEPTPCTAVVSLKFLSWEILEEKFNYDVQRHALLHLLVCSILGSYTHVEAHPQAYGCLLDFNGRLSDFNRKLERGYYLCSPHEGNCLRRVKASDYGDSIIQLCSTLKHRHDEKAGMRSIGELSMNKTTISIEGGSIGILNTGYFQNVGAITVHIQSLAASGLSDVAEALKRLMDAITNSEEMAANIKSDALEQLDELGRQAVVPVEKRSKLSVIKAVFQGLATTLSAVGGMAEVWSTWGTVIRKFFGF